MTSFDILQIIPIPAFNDNYIWAIIHPVHRQVIIVDPGDAAAVIHYLQKNKLKLQAIFITHHHGDHTHGIPEICQYEPVPVFGPHNKSIQGVTTWVAEPNEVKVNANFPVYQVLDIPGHTLDHIAYFAQGMLFCGDTLFAAGCGRLFEGSAAQMLGSLQKISALPDRTQIYCAHEYTLNNLRFAVMVESGNPAIHARIKSVQALGDQQLPSLPSSLSEEKATNPFLRCNSPEIIHRVEAYVGQPLEEQVAVFAGLRAWKDLF